MIFDIFFMELYLTLTLLRLKILWSLLVLGNYCITDWRNVFATFVERGLLKAWVNHIRFFFRVFGFPDLLLVYFKSNLQSDFNSYSTVTVLNISLLEELFGSLSEMEFDNCLIIFVVVRFLVWTIIAFCTFSITSRKTTSLRLVWMSILKAMSLKFKGIVFVFFCPFAGH